MLSIKKSITKFRRLSPYYRKNARDTGFTLIELLVVISIIGILMGLAIFGISGVRESARDADRKSDLELIRSGIEIFRADCGSYPSAVQMTAGGALTGDDVNCPAANTYITEIPTDPLETNQYSYSLGALGVTYEVCAALEKGTGTVFCGGSSNCGETCNYKVTNP